MTKGSGGMDNSLIEVAPSAVRRNSFQQDRNARAGVFPEVFGPDEYAGSELGSRRSFYAG